MRRIVETRQKPCGQCSKEAQNLHRVSTDWKYDLQTDDSALQYAFEQPKRFGEFSELISAHQNTLMA